MKKCKKQQILEDAEEQLEDEKYLEAVEYMIEEEKYLLEMEKEDSDDV